MTRAVLLMTVAALVAGTLHAPAAQPSNAIQEENARPGTTAWQLPATDAVELYGSEISAAPGDRIALHVSTAFRYRIVIYRLGWYAGDGARRVACLPGCESDEQGTTQPGPTGSEPIRADWRVTDTVRTTIEWTSGYYLVEAVLTSGPESGCAAWTFLVLRAPRSAPPAQILVQVPVNTWEAYNEWGGKSLYDFVPPRAHAVTFERPFGTRSQSPLWWEYQLVRFLERAGYDVSYQADPDTDRDPASLLQHQLVIVAGHDEYWTLATRAAFDRALARGTNLFFAGSNDAYWHMEYRDGGKTLFTYKSLYDPNPDQAQKTAMFREIGRPESCLMGVQHSFFAILHHQLDYRVTDAGAAYPWLAGTGLHAGDTIAGVVGREHDKLSPYPVACFHPGLTVLFHYDGGGVDQDGDAVVFTVPGGARVYASGAQQFSWALDDWRSDGSLIPSTAAESGVAVDPRVQAFVRNALSDLLAPPVPQGLRARIGRGLIRVRIDARNDPRVTGFVAAIAFGNGRWHRLCRGISTCSGKLPHTTDAIKVAAVELGRWDHSSAPAYANVQR